MIPKALFSTDNLQINLIFSVKTKPFFQEDNFSKNKKAFHFIPLPKNNSSFSQI